MVIMSRFDPDHDLDLAVELINTHWVLVDPPDRLTDTAAYQRILRSAGDAQLADELRPDDLPSLHGLRADLAPVFDLPTDEAVRRLDQLLRDQPVPARLAERNGEIHWAWSLDQHGMTALRSRLLAALAEHVISHGTIRLGVCQAAPCRCVYVDRSRARTRRYCCDQCNDRAAAAAYRRRRKP
jgi:predicted RNA-binding Zn ribbon-like protein